MESEPIRALARALAASLRLAAAPALAQLPTTITPDLFPFPGSHFSPASSFSAGRAVADRWLGRGRARFGIAGEWTHRADHYERAEDTGALVVNTYVADFSGEAAGGQAGVRVSVGEGERSVVLGGALRYMAELPLTGTETL